MRHRYFQALTNLSWREFTENREASFHSMRNIFIHTLGAIDYWLDFLQKQNKCSKKKFDDYQTYQDVKTYMEHVETRMNDYIRTLHTNDLQTKYTVRNDADETVEITAEDVLIHIFEEEVHHRGELIALLWQAGIKPPLMGWKNL